MRIRQAIDFKNGFESNTEKSYFMYIGKPDAWPVSTDTQGYEMPETVTDSAENTFQVVDDIIAARQVFGRDVALVVSRIPWTTGTVYDIFDSKIDPYSSDKKFYVLTEDFNVYKCISNNADGQSTVKPTATTTEEQITSDGYIWKFLYKIPESQYEFITTARSTNLFGFCVS